MSNATVVIAGPGAGKTYNMVEKVLSALIDLKANKFCCVITYTNAATENIRNRISKKIDIPTNLFIGTIHSFFYNFFVFPYLRIYIDEFSDIDKFDDNVELTYRESVNKSWLAGYNKNSSEFKTEKELISEGKICYRTSIYIAFEMSKNNKLIKLISNRIQFLFVDEYQDSDHFINDIFKKLINDNETIIYFIGDQKQNIQSITSFPSTIRNKVKDVLFDLKELDKINYFELKDNWRSSNEIVDFISNFQDFTQISKRNVNVCPILFVDETDLNKIYNKFEEIVTNQKIFFEKDIIYKVVIADSWKDDASKEYIKKLSSLKNEYDLTEVDNEMQVYKGSLYKIFENCLISSVNQSKKEIIENYFSNDVILFRIEILKLLKKYSRSKCIQYFIQETKKDKKKVLNDFYTNSIKQKFRENHNLEESSNGKKIKCDYFCRYIFSKSTSIDKEMRERVFCSTIHKFKGLEATCVLVIASSKNVLKKFIETESKRQNKTSRLGFVAFSRARQLLCIACLEGIDKDIIKKLEMLKVKTL